MASKFAMAVLAALVVAVAALPPFPPASTSPSAAVTDLQAAAPSSPAISTALRHRAVRASSWPTSQPLEVSLTSHVRATGTVLTPRIPFLGRLGPVTQGPPATRSGARRSTAPPSPKIALYSNLNSPGLTAAQGGGNTPPDSTGAIGPANYVEVVNSTISVRSRADLTEVGQIALADFVGNPSVGYCDPQMQWDPTAGRWLYAFIACNNAFQEFDFGWSKTADPTNLASGWCHFFIDTSTQLFDYPKLGHNSKYLIVGTNVFDVGSNQFSGAGILWVPKPAKGVTACTQPALGLSSFPLKNGDKTFAFTPVPVNTTTSATDGYVIAAYSPFTTDPTGPRTKLAVWHLDSVGVLHQNTDVNVSSFDLPPPAPEAGSTNVIDTLDSRLTQAVGDPVTGMWTQHTVAGPGGRTVVQWFEIKVNHGIASLAQQGVVASATDFVFNAAISPRTDAGGAAIFYNRSSTTLDPVIATQIRVSSTPVGTMEPGERVLASSTDYDDDFSCNNPTPLIPCRWGDYSGATPDPIVKTVVWGTNEFITAHTNAAAWADQNFAIQVLTGPHTPTAISAEAGRDAAAVSWTPSTFVPSTPVTSYTVTAYAGPTAVLTAVVAAPSTTTYFLGLTEGVTYTFTVFATNSVESSPESVHSAPVIVSRQAGQSTPAAPAPRPAGQGPSPSPGPRA